MRELEAWAIARGFEDDSGIVNLPFERNRLRQFGTVVASVRMTSLLPSVRQDFTVRRVMEKFLQHRIRHNVVTSDVIDPKFLTFSPVERRIASPLPSENFPAITVDTLLDAPLVPDPGCRTSTGGQPGPGTPLGHSRAEPEGTRAETQLEFPLG